MAFCCSRPTGGYGSLIVLWGADVPRIACELKRQAPQLQRLSSGATYLPGDFTPIEMTYPGVHERVRAVAKAAIDAAAAGHLTTVEMHHPFPDHVSDIARALRTAPANLTILSAHLYKPLKAILAETPPEAAARALVHFAIAYRGTSQAGPQTITYVTRKEVEKAVAQANPAKGAATAADAATASQMLKDFMLAALGFDKDTKSVHIQPRFPLQDCVLDISKPARATKDLLLYLERAQEIKGRPSALLDRVASLRFPALHSFTCDLCAPVRKGSSPCGQCLAKLRDSLAQDPLRPAPIASVPAPAPAPETPPANAATPPVQSTPDTPAATGPTMARLVYTEDFLRKLRSRGHTPPENFTAPMCIVVPPRRLQRQEERDQQKKTICLDFLKGQCKEKRWKCKFAHPAFPLLAGDPLVADTEEADSPPPQPLNPPPEIVGLMHSFPDVSPEAAARGPAEGQSLCDVWILTGFCKFGDRCKFYHCPRGTLPAPRLLPAIPAYLREGDNASEAAEARTPEAQTTTPPVTPPTATVRPSKLGKSGTPPAAPAPKRKETQGEEPKANKPQRAKDGAEPKSRAS
eukprot:TRINITY_DN16652_c0_g1_i1.p1 TRINITY_DN16652_c0_g1~~TRINITY_DN16652_c0_g1_i1.p1  ORF type:complete len:577 (+),score=59.18 TRINITY_DN16652_c0_g1_i1:104-1834(+)